MISLKNTLEAITKALSVDYIVEQGTSGIWTYRKWNSGIAECWGTFSFTATSTGTWGQQYYLGGKSTKYPFTFSAVPQEFVTGISYQGSSWIYKDAGNTTSETGMYSLAKANNSYGQFVTPQTVKYYFQVIGRWK